MKRKILVIGTTFLMACSLCACGTSKEKSNKETNDDTTSVTIENSTDNATNSDSKTEEEKTNVNVSTDGIIDTSDIFSDRDLTQTIDLTDAKYYEVKDDTDINITTEGIYVISGTAANASIIIDVDDEEKVQIVLDKVSITNDDTACIYVKNADKVFVTTTDSENSLSVTGTYVADDSTNVDAVIFSKDDLVLNGTGTLVINSTDNGIASKNDLKITGGNINISCSGSALEAEDKIAIADGNITITNCNDGIHAENDEDDTLGFVYICEGTLDITAKDDGIHAVSIVQIDDGDISINAAEGIEGTYVQINEGNINVTASDDGINGAQKSSSYTATIEMNGGNVTIAMGAGDTDGIDSNGNLYINGGTVDITGQSAFDYDGIAEYNGGTIIVNGTQTDTITNQMFGGMEGGMGGQMPGGQMPGGQMPNGEMPGGEMPGGEMPDGQMQRGPRPGGQMPDRMR